MTVASGKTPVDVRRSLVLAFQAFCLVAYPLVIYFAHARLSTRVIGAVLLLLYAVALAFRVRAPANDSMALLRQHLPLALLISLAIATGKRTLLLLVPVIVSAYLFATFAWSLRDGPPMIERFARLVEDDLPPFTLPYCRRVTALWCGFLAANSIAIAVLAFTAPIAWWAAYTGFGFYLLLGTLLVAELCVRKWWFRYYGPGAADRLFARFFPPDATPAGRRSLAYVAARERRRAASPQQS